MKTTTKKITRTLKVITDKRYDEVIVVDEHYCEVWIMGVAWQEAGYTWEKDIQPIIDNVRADGIERTMVLTRTIEVKTFGSIEDHKRFAAKIENGYGDADIN